MTEPAHVRVAFRKQVSDGNYGTEAAEVNLECDVEPGEDQAPYITALLAQARLHVHAELLRSPSSAVRRVLESPKLPRSVPVTSAIAVPDDSYDEDLPFDDR